jgi:flagellar FliL protein
MAQEEAAASEGGGEGKKKSSLVKIIILVALLAALGGGGFFGYMKFFKKPSTEAKEPVVEQPVTQEMGTYLVNLSDPGGKRYLKVTMQFELSGAKVSQELAKRSVEVRDRIIMLLSSKEYEDIGNPTGKVTLKKEMMAQLNKTLQDGQVKEIYFTEFLVQ